MNNGWLIFSLWFLLGLREEKNQIKQILGHYGLRFEQYGQSRKGSKNADLELGQQTKAHRPNLVHYLFLYVPQATKVFYLFK